MKKYFMFALATVAMLSVSSCMNEKEMDLAPNQGKIESEGYGYISLNATTDEAVVTRAEYTGAGLSNWWAKVIAANGTGDQVYGTGGAYKKIGTDKPGDFAKTGFKEDKTTGYKIFVQNYNGQDGADGWMAANDGYGDAYWTGDVDGIKVTAGQTTQNVIVPCNTPDNAKVSFYASEFGGTALSVNVTAPRALTFTWDATDTKKFKDYEDAYFVPSTSQNPQSLSYTISYTINGNTATTASKSLAIGEKGVWKKLAIKSNDNGTITLKITTEDFTHNELTDVTTIEFDAATGAEK